ncbi:type VI secretion system Vgr family protein [Collimonas humicola]|uniref:type VI secretion system Vgr family protein n=1 Tax=Collimonas humicola TaxID=2825886 RepID=UPI001B8B7107|nr:type VI secretion system tip protein TssI/VgrG [Collimonas humicola]
MQLINLDSPLLNADCTALSWKVAESLSREPKYELQLVSPDSNLDLDGLLGDTVAVAIELSDGTSRDFHAFVFGAYDTGQMGDKYTYTLELGSWLSFLEENQNYRIFQNLSVPEIVEQVFAGHQRSDYRFDLEQSYQAREYCVQFRETDLQFVKRLLEDEGIYFWVEQEADRHVIVLSDTQKFLDLPEPYAQMRFLPDGGALNGREGIQRLQRTRRIRPNNIALRDFDYLVPTNALDSDAQIDQQTLAGVTLMYYDYGAGYSDFDRGERLAQLRLDALQAESHMLQGESNARGLAVGQAFTLAGHPDPQRNRRFYLTAIELSFVQDGPDSTSLQGPNVLCTFRALLDDQPFRPLCLTLKPAVPGIHSATVVGPPDSEVHTDKLGRIRVHFHWDRYKTTEEDASCWMRVSQAWAGKGWGVLAMPRVGQEVLITYVDGDLDRPLVTGIVYNGDNPTPYDLPKDIRYSGIVSRSLKQGKYQNASQLTFDDQAGAERVMIHAERDLQKTVERNSSESVGQDKNVQIGLTETYTAQNGVKYTAVSVSYTGLACSHTGISFSCTGVSTDFKGVTTSFAGVSTSFTGVSTSFAGVSNSFTGISTGFKGIDTSFTGISTSIVGSSTSITGEKQSLTGVSTSLTGVDVSATGAKGSVTGVSLSVTGFSTSVTGTDIGVTGFSNKTTGVSVSEVGSDTSVKGITMSTTGVSTSVTGSSMSTTGNSISLTASSMSSTQFSIKSDGVSISRKQTSIKSLEAVFENLGFEIKN